MIRYMSIDSPVGALLLAGSDAGLHLIEFENPRHPDSWVRAAFSRLMPLPRSVSYRSSVA